MKCKRCSGEMIQKSRPRLLFVGLAMCSSIALAFFYKFLWAPAILLALAGAYLIIWATLGKGQWCRNCKMFNL
jgi:hypothetical protein